MPSTWCPSRNWTQALWSQPKLTELLNSVQLWDRGVWHNQWPTVGCQWPHGFGTGRALCWLAYTGLCLYVFFLGGVSGKHGSCSLGHLRTRLGKCNCHELFFRNLKWHVFLLFIKILEELLQPIQFIWSRVMHLITTWLHYKATYDYIQTLVNLEW